MADAQTDAQIETAARELATQGGAPTQGEYFEVIKAQLVSAAQVEKARRYLRENNISPESAAGRALLAAAAPAEQAASETSAAQSRSILESARQILNSSRLKELEAEKAKLEAEAKITAAAADVVSAKKEIAEVQKSSAVAEEKAAAAQETAAAAKKAAEEVVTAAARLEGLGFGPGISLTINGDSRQRVKKAAIDPVSKKLVVEEDSNHSPRFLLESHYFFTTPRGDWFITDNLSEASPGAGIKVAPKPTMGPNSWRWWPHVFGPFVCIEPSGEAIDSIGGGLLIGWARQPDPKSKQVVRSFNLGLGWVVDQNVQVLGDGLAPGMVLNSDADIRYRKTSKGGIVLMFSAGF